jgi:CubicO group peptidase (beta-lactamase class C family)
VTGFDPARLARLDKHFAQYVDDDRLTGWQLTVVRRGEVAHSSCYGLRDRENGLPVEPDTIFRIASMTKPITSVAAMTLWEEGAFELNDPISRWLPAFESVRVYDKGTAAALHTVPAVEPIRVWHLLTHTSGLTAGFMHQHVVDELYRAAGFDMATSPDGATLESVTDTLSTLPLLFQPGTRWGYGASTDVLGRLLEIITGQPFDEIVATRVTGPLGMRDTVWWADETRVPRLSQLYTPHPETGLATHMPVLSARVLQRPTLFSAGGGLLSTSDDYVRFMRMMLGNGELDGTRVLAPRTVRMMTTNQLGADLGTLSTGGFAETTFDGVGFGLGFATIDDPTKLRNGSSGGEYYWGGAANTAFWIDPKEDLAVVFLAQLLPANQLIRSQLRQLVYSAMVD